MKAVRKAITELADTLPAEEFKVDLRNLYVESHRYQHGSNYFTWVKPNLSNLPLNDMLTI